MAAVFSPRRWTGRFALAPGWSHPGLGAARCRRFVETPSPSAMVSATCPRRTNHRGSLGAVDSARAFCRPGAANWRGRPRSARVGRFMIPSRGKVHGGRGGSVGSSKTR